MRSQLKFLSEYWVIDVLGKRAIAFRLGKDGIYHQCTHSTALDGLPMSLLDRTLARLAKGTNISAANWFAQQLTEL